MKGKLYTCIAGGVMAVALATPALASSENSEQTGGEGGLAEIVVTAQRRAENLQNVPIAITAASGEALATARVENISNIQAVSPSIAFQSTNIASSTANVIIRGLGTTGNSRSFEGSVGVFIDGVYRTRAAAALQNFLDIDGLQVLRGPQGTLFGKNTTAGALLLNSAAPSTQETRGMVEATYGNYQSLLVRGALNAPLSDTVAVRIAGLASSRDGFYTDVNTGEDLNGDKTRAVKAQVQYDSGNGFSMRLIGDYSFGEGNCCYATSAYKDGPTQPVIDALTTFQPVNSTQFLGLLAGLVNPSTVPLTGRTVPSADPKKWEQGLNGNGHQTIEDYGATLLVDADLGAGTLKSVTSIRQFNLDQADMDPDFSGADIFRYYETFHSRFISQELTYNTKIEALNADAVFGAFFSDEKLNMDRVMPWGPQAQAFWDTALYAAGIAPGTASAPVGPWIDEDMRGKARSYAGFAHLDFAVNDKLNVIAGLRYSVEKKQGAFKYDRRPQVPTFTQLLAGTGIDPFMLLGVAPGPEYDRSITDKAVSGTFGIQYRPVDDVMIYATYNRGFKAGGVNIDANAAGVLINNKPVYDALNALLAPLAEPGDPVPPPAKDPGDPSYRPEKINAFEVGAKIQYLDRRARTNIALFYYDVPDMQIAQFVGLQFTVLNAKSASDYGVDIENLFQLNDALTLAVDGTWVPRAKYGEDPSIGLLSGQRFRFAPRLSANATLNLDTPINDSVNVVGRVQYQYTSSQLINAAGDDERGRLSLVNANLGFKLPGKNLLVEGWVQNLFNKTYFSQAFPTPLQTGDLNGYLGAPRTYGVRVRLDF